MIAYFSTKSENTHRFVQRLNLPAVRIPILATDEIPEMSEDYILITPTYGGGEVKGAVPPAVVRFLKAHKNKERIRGVIAAGNTNFGEAFCIAGKVISRNCNVPYLDRFELTGTDADLQRIRTGVMKFWKHN